MADKPTNVQISRDLFMDLCKVVLGGTDNPEIIDRTRKGLRDKMDRVILRDLYSTYKNPNLSPEDREKARRDYLDRAGIPESFRW